MDQHYGVFPPCQEGRHEACRTVLGKRIRCRCACHAPARGTAAPCQRCGGSGYFGPITVEHGLCLACRGTGKGNEQEGGPHALEQ